MRWGRLPRGVGPVGEGVAPRAARAPVTVPRGETSPARVSTTLRRAEAAALRCEGKSFRAIGEALGITATNARKLVIGALADVTFEAADLMRAQEGERLDALQAAVWADAMGGDVRAVVAVLRIMDARAKLFGLYAPTEVRAEVVGGATLDGEVARLEQLARGVGASWRPADAVAAADSGGAGGVAPGVS